MGYTVYWARDKEIDPDTFDRIVNDFKQLLPVFKILGVKLDIAVLNNEEVSFNGIEKCGHPKNAKVYLPTIIIPRECDGNCSQEQFVFKRTIQDEYPGKAQSSTITAFKPYDIAVTAFLVIVKHHLPDNLFVYSSEGDTEFAVFGLLVEKQKEIERFLQEFGDTSYLWMDAIRICESVLGYGKNSVLDSSDLLNQLFDKKRVWQILREKSEMNVVSWDELLKSALMSGIKSEKDLAAICSEYEHAGIIVKDEKGGFYLSNRKEAMAQAKEAKARAKETQTTILADVQTELGKANSSKDYDNADSYYRSAKEKLDKVYYKNQTDQTDQQMQQEIQEILKNQEEKFLRHFDERVTFLKAPVKPVILKILLAGGACVGKTTFLIRLLNKSFEIILKQTFGIDFSLTSREIAGKKVLIQIYDLAGTSRYLKFFTSFVKGANGAILMYAITQMCTLDNMEEWVGICRAEDKNLPILFCGTKLDLVEERSVSPDYAKGFLQPLGLFDYFEVSARTGENVERAFETLIRKIIERERTSE